MTKLSTKLKDELFKLLPPTIFFFVALHIVTFVRVLALKGTGISPLSSMSIAVAALILGKAVFLAHKFDRSAHGRGEEERLDGRQHERRLETRVSFRHNGNKS